MCILVRRNEKYSLLFIYFKNPFFQPCYPTLLFDTTKLKITLDQESYEEIFGPVSMYIAIYAKQKSIFIQQFFFFLIFSPDRIIFRLEIIREYRMVFFKRIETVDLSWKKLFPRINRERFIRGIRRFRRNSWFSLRQTSRRFFGISFTSSLKTLLLFASVIRGAYRPRIFVYFSIFFPFEILDQSEFKSFRTKQFTSRGIHSFLNLNSSEFCLTRVPWDKRHMARNRSGNINEQLFR